MKYLFKIMFHINPVFNFSFKNLFKSKKNKKKHELKYENFLKSIENLEKDNIIDLVTLKLLYSQYDILILINLNNNEVLKYLGAINNDITQKFTIIRIPIKSSKYLLILGFISTTKFKLKQNYIDLLSKYLE